MKGEALKWFHQRLFTRSHTEASTMTNLEGKCHVLPHRMKFWVMENHMFLNLTSSVRTWTCSLNVPQFRLTPATHSDSWNAWNCTETSDWRQDYSSPKGTGLFVFECKALPCWTAAQLPSSLRLLRAGKTAGWEEEALSASVSHPSKNLLREEKTEEKNIKGLFFLIKG